MWVQLVLIECVDPPNSHTILIPFTVPVACTEGGGEIFTHGSGQGYLSLWTKVLIQLNTATIWTKTGRNHSRQWAKPGAVWLAVTKSLSDQIRSVAQSCPTLYNPMNRSMPGFPVHHHLPEFTQSHVHRVSDAIQPSHPLSSPSHLAPNPSQHQSLFQWVNTSHEVAKVLEFQL